jgi:hypothetical protein
VSQLLLQDAGDGGKLKWATASITAGLAGGMILSPFDTPAENLPRRPSAATMASALKGVNGSVYFDAATYGAELPSADKFSYYDTWQLWPGARADLSTPTRRDRHVAQVMQIASDIGATPISPTFALTSPIDTRADHALEMMASARRASDAVVLSIVGTEEFWRSGPALDAFVGRVAALRPAAFSVAIMRQTLHYPYLERHPDEVFGICRAVHALSLRGALGLAQYGDLAALPSLAAGASLIGTGWNIGQRQLSHALFRTSGGGTASYRPTYEGLMAAFKAVEAQRFESGSAAASHLHYPGPLPPARDKNSHWRHHLEVLNRLVDETSRGRILRRDLRSRRLRTLYGRASVAFVNATTYAAPLAVGVAHWIGPVQQGLELYMAEEGY